MKKYTASRVDGYPVVRVHDDDRRVHYRLQPNRSQRLCNHSPDGFEWAYGGSGPSQLALAILLDVTGDPDVAELLHQPFKWQYVATAPKDGFSLTEDDVRTWVSAQQQSREQGI